MSYNYEIVFTAQNYVSSTTQQLRSDIQELNSDLKNANSYAINTGEGFQNLSIQLGNVKNASQNLDVVSESIIRMAQNFRILTFGLQMSLFSMSMMVSQIYSNESATLNLQYAEENYAKALRESGRNSEQARSALRSLQNAQINYNKASTLGTMQTISLGLQFVSLGVAAAQTIPNIVKLIGTLQKYNTVAAITHALSGVKGWAMLIGAGIAVGAATTYGVLSTTQKSTVDVDVKVDYQSDIISEFLRRRGATSIRNSGVTP